MGGCRDCVTPRAKGGSVIHASPTRLIIFNSTAGAVFLLTAPVIGANRWRVKRAHDITILQRADTDYNLTVLPCTRWEAWYLFSCDLYDP